MSDFEAQFAIIRRQYIASLSEKIEEACSLWDDTENVATREQVELFKMKIHSFVGAASTFELEDISKLARDIEDRVVAHFDEIPTSEPVRLRISLLLEKMRVALAKVLATETQRATSPDVDAPVVAPDTVLLQHNGPHYARLKSGIEDADGDAPTRDHARKSDKPTIMVVDDDEQVRMAVGSFLATKGYRVRTATDGRDALGKVLREIPDLVVTDYLMPRGAGHYLISRLRNTVETKDLPIIVLTGHRLIGGDDPHGLKRALVGEMHVNDFLMKPLNFDALYQSVLRCLQPSLDELRRQA